jgi:tetratricopeptide (TPR) repeat protein
MTSAQDQYDDAMFDFSQGDFAGAAARLEALLAVEPEHFDARLSLGMAWCRLGDFGRAIAEGHRAEALRPNEQLVHTNLSLFYVKAGDKPRAEHHGLQARIASWRGNMAAPGSQPPPDPDLELAKPPPPPPPPSPPAKVPEQFPDMPWKRKPAASHPPAVQPPAAKESPL